LNGSLEKPRNGQDGSSPISRKEGSKNPGLDDLYGFKYQKNHPLDGRN
jgi:hypothetical protein